MRWILCCLALLSSVAFASGEQDGEVTKRKGSEFQLAETALINGKIFTADERYPYVSALLIRGKVIVKIGSDEEVLAHAQENATVYDLGGRTVVPGFNDAHAHAGSGVLGETLNTGDFVPGPGPSAAEVHELLAAKVAETPEGTWIFGRVGNAYLEDPEANRFSLDQIAPNHPVKMTVWAGHGTVINTAAMEATGIDEHQPDPPGGLYGRVGDTTELNGVLYEYAESALWRALLEPLTDGDVQAAYTTYAYTVTRLGVTTVQNIPIGIPKDRMERILSPLDLPVRWRSICYPLTPEEECGSEIDGPRFKSSQVSHDISSSGIKWHGDGTPVERMAALRDPYADAETSGHLNWDGKLDELLAKSRYGSKRANQLICHAMGDATIDFFLEGLDAYDEGATWNGRRTRLEHGDMLHQDQFELMLKHGVILVQNPTHFALAEAFFSRLGPERFSVAQPLRSVIEAGIPVAFGHDSALGNISHPFFDIMMAVTHPGNPDEAITVEQAVTAYTQGSAYAEFEERWKGTLVPGKFADLAVLSQDIFTIHPLSIAETISLMTIKGGDVVWNSGVLNPQ